MQTSELIAAGWVRGKVAVGRELAHVDGLGRMHHYGRVLEVRREGRRVIAVTDKGCRQRVNGLAGNGRRPVYLTK